jgi:hypothetical protein
MTRQRLNFTLCLALTMLVGAVDAAPVVTAPEARLIGISATTLRADLNAWLTNLGIDANARQQIDQQLALHGDVPRSQWVDRVVQAVAAADPRAARLVEQCSRPRSGALPADVSWLADPRLPASLVRQLRLYYGRWLAQQQLYDESLEQLRELDPAEVVDPAGLLFYQGVAHHRLLEKEAGLKAIDKLLNDVPDAPQRYRALARLMERDLEALDDETLDHVARRMDDVRRRLGLGHGGKRVRRIEDGVLESLDKLIEDLEKQQQQQQNSGSSSGGARTPMQTPQLATAQGAGDVEHRRIGNTTDWGNLPDKERQRALQEIGKDFPAHYRDVVEQYFRSLATEEERP